MAAVANLPIHQGCKLNHYEVFNLIGKGGFGPVFEVYDDMKNEVELKKPNEDEPGLDLETSVLKIVQSSQHCVRYVDSGTIGDYKYLVMQLVGRSLSALQRSCPQYRFTTSTALRVGLQCYDAIETLHAFGLLHRDIKPANYAIGLNNSDKRTVFLLDFGLVRRFKSSAGSIRDPRPAVGFRGTVRYASLNCHNRIDLGRHDDLWSWTYVLIEFLKGSLPWHSESDIDKVMTMKSTHEAELLANVDVEITKIYNSVIKLDYYDEPPYHHYREMLNSVLQRNHVVCSDPFDWEEGGAYYSAKEIVLSDAQKKKKAKHKKIKGKKKKAHKKKDDKEV